MLQEKHGVRDCGAVKGALLLIEWISAEPGRMGTLVGRWRGNGWERGNNTEAGESLTSVGKHSKYSVAPNWEV